MALSNWDCEAFNEKGGYAASWVEWKDVRCKIYKNRLFVTIGETVMEFWEGHLCIPTGEGFIEIFAARSPRQASVFCFAQWGEQILAGVGVYAYDEHDAFVGVTDETMNEFKRWLTNLDHMYWSPDEQWLALMKGEKK
jgi:hypothetical protein